jgi:hypothetical protein
MKTQNTADNIHVGTIRAGVISLLVPAIGYLWMSGLSDVTRVWLFIISFAACFALMMFSVVDLLVAGFGLAARFSGKNVGRVVSFFRRRHPRLTER